MAVSSKEPKHEPGLFLQDMNEVRNEMSKVRVPGGSTGLQALLGELPPAPPDQMMPTALPRSIFMYPVSIESEIIDKILALILPEIIQEETHFKLTDRGQHDHEKPFRVKTTLLDRLKKHALSCGHRNCAVWLAQKGYVALRNNFDPDGKGEVARAHQKRDRKVDDSQEPKDDRNVAILRIFGPDFFREMQNVGIKHDVSNASVFNGLVQDVIA